LGWRDSEKKKFETNETYSFRPRVGMGWFYSNYNENTCCNGFSSPLGDGLVHSTQLNSTKENFRPRVGIGWFLMDLPDVDDLKIFVPEWGWVGSSFTCRCFRGRNGFRPRLGMGWFCMGWLDDPWRKRFRPRLGMGWFINL